MTVTILCVEYLAGDDIVFDAFRDVFTSELVQVRGELCFITCVQTTELELKIHLFMAHHIYFFHDGFCWYCINGRCRRYPMYNEGQEKVPKQVYIDVWRSCICSWIVILMWSENIWESSIKFLEDPRA